MTRDKTRLITAVGTVALLAAALAAVWMGSVAMVRPPAAFAQVTQNAQQVLEAAFDTVNTALGVSQKGTWTVQPGNTANTTPWLVKGPVIQADTLQNSQATSGANAALTTSIAAVAGQKVYLYHVEGRCSAGTSSLTVKNGVGGTAIWSSAATEVGTTTFFRDFGTPLANSTGNGMDVVLAACGSGNTGTLIGEASQF